MDKETLSNYGWIVICVLVLAVMIALATPFGSFVSDAVKSTTQGLFDVNQGALDAAGIVIDDNAFADGGNGGTETPVDPTPVVPEWDGTDLTGTSWVFGLSISHDYSTAFNYNVDFYATLNYQQKTVVSDVVSGLKLTAKATGDYYFPSASITMYNQDGSIDVSAGSFYYGYRQALSLQNVFRTDFVSFIITITGGTDATNPDLIAWLEANATRIE